MKIELNVQHLEAINAALMELPYRLAAPVIHHLNNEILKCTKEAENSKKEDVPSGGEPQSYGENFE